MPMGDLAAQDQYDLPDVGAPLISGGPQVSAGVPWANNLVTSLTTPRPEAPEGNVYYSSPYGTITDRDIGRGIDLGMGFSGGGLGIRAYHSSPHDFERFDLSKIGTGEGAQVYGHGLYFAESPKVSGQGGQYWNSFLNKFQGPEATAALALKRADFDRTQAIADLTKKAEGGYDINPRIMKNYNPFDDVGLIGGGGIKEGYQKELELLRSGAPVGPRTYEVNINADPAHFLDWDKTLSQQSPAVQERLQQLGIKANKGDINKWMDDLEATLRNPNPTPDLGPAPFNPTGADLYRSHLPRETFAVRPTPTETFQPHWATNYQDALASAGNDPSRVRIIRTPSPQAATERLMSAEIPGIKYLDQGSRATGTGTSNYVVFNDKLIDILKKYGIVGALGAGGMGSLAAQDNYQQ